MRTAHSALAAGLLAASLLSGPALASNTLRVPADFPTIQTAIAAAVDGDVVLVADGTYAETLDLLGKAITVRSENGPGATTVDGGGQAVYVVRFASGEGPQTRLEGFTITGGIGRTYFNQQTVTGEGGGIRVHAASPVLRDLVITANSGPFGGGLRISGSSQVRIEDTLFVGNEGTTGGGLFSTLSKPKLVGVIFTDNLALNGGGLYAEGHELTIEGAQFRENTGTSLGGGMYLNSLHAKISGVVAERNGELVQLGQNSVTYTVLGGGGVYATNISGRIRESVFADNTAWVGGGLYLAGTANSVRVVNCLIRGNQSGAYAGGIYFNDCSATVVNSTILNNFPAGLFTTYAAFPTVTNSILFGNGGPHYPNAEIYGNGVAYVSYSLTGTPLLWGASVGQGVILADPLLDANARPQAGSPVIDAGDNDAVPTGILIDLAGDPRFRDDPATVDTGLGLAPVVDMGAFEFQPMMAPAPARRRR